MSDNIFAATIAYTNTAIKSNSTLLCDESQSHSSYHHETLEVNYKIFNIVIISIGLLLLLDYIRNQIEVLLKHKSSFGRELLECFYRECE